MFAAACALKGMLLNTKMSSLHSAVSSLVLLSNRMGIHPLPNKECHHFSSIDVKTVANQLRSDMLLKCLVKYHLR